MGYGLYSSENYMQYEDLRASLNLFSLNIYRSMTVGILSQVCQWLLSLDVSALCAEMLNHLFLLETAAKSMLIKQQVRFNSHSIIYMYNRFIKIFM